MIWRWFENKICEEKHPFEACGWR